MPILFKNKSKAECSDLSPSNSTEEEDKPLSPQDKHLRLPKNSKLKRSLCRNYTEFGYCPYGVKCQFAHGHEELVWNAEKRGMYRTKPCNFFLKKSYCQFGSRCNFSHKMEDIEEKERKEEKEQKRLNFREILYEGKSLLRHRTNIKLNNEGQ